MSKYYDREKRFFNQIKEQKRIIPIIVNDKTKNFFNFLYVEENKKIPYYLTYLDLYPLYEDNKYFIRGSLRLNSLNIDFIPDNLIVGGDLHLSFSTIHLLDSPINITVLGNLYLNCTKITPKSFPIKFILHGGSVHLYQSYLEKRYTYKQLKIMFPNTFISPYLD